MGIANTIGKALRPLHAGDDKLMTKRLQRGQPAKITVTSAAFDDGAPMPRRYAQEGENASPPLRIDGVPPDTREIVVVCEDPDAPMPHPFLHWLAYGMEPALRELPEDIPQAAAVDGVRQAKNTSRHVGYDGPAPPRGHGVHHYHFQVFALGRPLEISASPSRDEVVDAMRGHILAYGELVGTYERN